MARNHSTVVYLSKDGELCEDALGTIDHPVRVTDGGDDSLANLVISCHSCNQERDRTTLAYNCPFALQQILCPNCGGRFNIPDEAVAQFAGRCRTTRNVLKMARPNKPTSKIVKQLIKRLLSRLTTKN